MFASQSQARVMQSHFQLATLNKGSSSIVDYFHKFKNLVDTLAAVDKPLSDFEKPSFLLRGLSNEYDPFVTSVYTRADPLSIEDLYGHLLAHEQHLEHNQPTVDLSTANVNFAAKRGSIRGGRGGRSSYFQNSGRGYSSNSSHHRNYRGRGRGKGPSSYSQSHLLMCQLCRKPGHDAIDCYHRFDQTFHRDSTPNYQAFFLASSANFDSVWYPDSGATHHLTSDLANLNLNAETYSGSEQIRMGNGNGVSIEHIGDTHLSTPTTSFLLRNVLHVPLVTKNLLSVHKFTLNTNTYIEFHPWYFFVKEQGSGKVLLQGLNENGLYKLPPSVQLRSSGQSSLPSFHSVKFKSSSSSNRSGRVPSLSSSSVLALVGERTSLENWHSRLGHPTLRLCSRVLAKFNLPVFKSHDFLSCSACLMSKSKQLSFPLS
jgi:hypothetical protein